MIVRVDPTFSTGNFFSLDGVTPSAFEEAVIANELIKTINTVNRDSRAFKKCSTHNIHIHSLIGKTP